MSHPPPEDQAKATDATPADDVPTLSPSASGHAPTRPFTPTPSAGGLLLPSRFGRYEIRTLLGKGGMGAVYLAHDPHLDRLVALKVPNFAAGESEELTQRFFREARAAATLNHPGICPVFDV